jgi:glutamate racemase
MSTGAPIGVFDSGLGGLSVAREIRARLPGEPLLYFADTAYCPYGGRPLEQIRERSLVAVGELVRRGASVVVVACNTASGAALEAVRGVFDLPIVGLEPAVKPAAAGSRRGRVGVLATGATLKTDRFDRLLREHARDVEVIPQACPGLVELVEAGQTEGEEVHAALRALLEPLSAAEIDAAVLGCTHYPFLRTAIQMVLGPNVQIFDSGAAVARQVERTLEARGVRSASADGGPLHLLTTGESESVRPVAQRLWGGEIRVEEVRV